MTKAHFINLHDMWFHKVCKKVTDCWLKLSYIHVKKYKLYSRFVENTMHRYCGGNIVPCYQRYWTILLSLKSARVVRCNNAEQYCWQLYEQCCPHNIVASCFQQLVFFLPCKWHKSFNLFRVDHNTIVALPRLELELDKASLWTQAKNLEARIFIMTLDRKISLNFCISHNNMYKLVQMSFAI